MKPVFKVVKSTKGEEKLVTDFTTESSETGVLLHLVIVKAGVEAVKDLHKELDWEPTPAEVEVTWLRFMWGTGVAGTIKETSLPASMTGVHIIE